jgi:hypothetical protein
MLQTKGKFILCSVDAFAGWLTKAAISRSISLIQIHHTCSPAYAQFKQTNHFDLLSSMESFHVKERGFDMIAQNLTVFPDGTVAVCRPLDRIPAGIKGANQNGICLETFGNFDSGEDIMTISQQNAVVQVSAILCNKFGLTPSTESIVYHHWYDQDTGRRTDGAGNTKSCPGSAFFGDNSVQAAQDNFIPQVSAALAVENRGIPSGPLQPLRLAEVAVVGDLNVRSGPDNSFSLVKKLGGGVVVKVFEEKAGWCRIQPVEQQWVSSRYLQ